MISDCNTNVCNVSHNIDVTDVQNAVQLLKHDKSEVLINYIQMLSLMEVMSCIIIVYVIICVYNTWYYA